MLYGTWVAPNQLTVTTYTITSPKIPTGKHIRIVHLADLHIRQWGPREKNLTKIVQDLKPDLILHSGDFQGTKEDISPLIIQLLQTWHVPQYLCQGNLDDAMTLWRVAQSKAAILLNGTRQNIDIRGTPLCILGAPCHSSETLPLLSKELPQDRFNIVLYHRPEGFASLENTPADLMLAGHTHGGQICLPLYGALITLDAFGKRWESGHFIEHGMHLIVSRGIGCEPYLPEVRFWCPPEIVVIELVGKGTPSTATPPDTAATPTQAQPVPQPPEQPA